jgi:hypothetical protein
MPYTAQFFAEKLNVPVEYFNPFRNVQIDPAVNLEELARVAHSMGEVVGLGLRNLAHCPVELNLMPESTRKWRDFNEKKPFLIATVFTIVAVVAVIGLLFQQLSSVKASRFTNIKPKLDAANSRNNEFSKAYGELTSAKTEMDQLAGFTTNRYYWVDTLPEIRKILVHVEMVTSNKWHAPSGIWIEQFVTPSAPDVSANPMMSGANPDIGNTLEQAIDLKYSLGVDPTTAALVPPVPGSGVSTIVMVCRARKGADESANSDLMYALLDNLKANPLFDPKATQVGQKLITDDSPYTFTFAVKVTLAKPLKL